MPPSHQPVPTVRLPTFLITRELPDVFKGVQLGRFRRQRYHGNVVGNFEGVGEVPPGLIDNDDGMSTGRDGGGDLLELQHHGDGVAFGQNKGRTGTPARADGAEDIGEAGPLILGRRGARALT